MTYPNSFLMVGSLGYKPRVFQVMQYSQFICGTSDSGGARVGVGEEQEAGGEEQDADGEGRGVAGQDEVSKRVDREEYRTG